MALATDHPYIELLAAHLGSRYSSHTKRAWIGHAHQFIEIAGTKTSYSRSEVLAYVDRLILKGYRQESIDTILTGVRAMFRECGLTWPVDSRDLRLGMPQEDPQAPVLLPAEVAKLIRAVRGTPGLPRTVTALATIWGLRGDEILRVLATGCSGVMIDVQTAKGGRKREHAIPVVMKPVLSYAPMKVSARYLHAIFERRMETYVRPSRPREGWHAVRRSVVTGLYERGATTEQIHRWFGWREIRQGNAGLGIAFRYYRPDPQALDAEIYQRHPFLAEWVSA